jgi:hypothetical protein
MASAIYSTGLQQKIVFKISTFLYRFLCAELKTNNQKILSRTIFFKTNFSFQGLFIYIHMYWTINTTLKTGFIRFHQTWLSLSHFLPSFIDKQNTVHPVQLHLATFVSNSSIVYNVVLFL